MLRDERLMLAILFLRAGDRGREEGDVGSTGVKSPFHTCPPSLLHEAEASPSVSALSRLFALGIQHLLCGVTQAPSPSSLKPLISFVRSLTTSPTRPQLCPMRVPSAPDGIRADKGIRKSPEERLSVVVPVGDVCGDNVCSCGLPGLSRLEIVSQPTSRTHGASHGCCKGGSVPFAQSLCGQFPRVIDNGKKCALGNLPFASAASSLGSISSCSGSSRSMLSSAARSGLKLRAR
mmetsp:Transcript_73219/g.203087  ORF Transcript_73219/g.203087 Transcript_73219/m.203087 type:complete len:234 (-) Transcript_73219:970-1671(-)